MMVGLQGAGKTTSCGKLARLFKAQGKRVLLVAADPRRPAAGDQLSALGRDLGIEVHRFDQAAGSRPDVVRICREGVERGRDQGFDLVVLDTGGRLHIDDEMMDELVAVKAAVAPQEVLLVADAMTGQDAVAMASQFDRQVGLTGFILTKVEGDARGGAVLSIRAVTGKPIKFLGVGEKLDALEPFHPDRMASRILGMGDMLSLIEKAQETFTREEAEQAQQRLTGHTFTLEDFRTQIGQMNRLGSLDQILGMLPGGQKLKGVIEGDKPGREMKQAAAMIDSMTARERRDHTIINGSRKKRIARGSGTSVQEVNRLIKQFLSAKKLAKAMTEISLQRGALTTQRLIFFRRRKTRGSSFKTLSHRTAQAADVSACGRRFPEAPRRAVSGDPRYFRSIKGCRCARIEAGPCADLAAAGCAAHSDRAHAASESRAVEAV
jgi:signal recognition particle subunit SRP54